MVELDTIPPFFADKQELVGEILGRYPEVGKRSAVMPLLWEVQRAERYISEARINEIAEILDLHPTEVKGVMSFYSEYHGEPVGKYHLQVCSTLSCSLAGSDQLYDYLVAKLGIVNGATDNAIGGRNTTPGTRDVGNVISGNGRDGVRIAGAATSGNAVQGNFVGTNVAGDAAPIGGPCASAPSRSPTSSAARAPRRWPARRPSAASTSCAPCATSPAVSAASAADRVVAGPPRSDRSAPKPPDNALIRQQRNGWALVATEQH